MDCLEKYHCEKLLLTNMLKKKRAGSDCFYLLFGLVL